MRFFLNIKGKEREVFSFIEKNGWDFLNYRGKEMIKIYERQFKKDHSGLVFNFIYRSQPLIYATQGDIEYNQSFEESFNSLKKISKKFSKYGP